MPLRVVVTGITGQDGYYLTRELRKLGADIYGVVRRSARDTEKVHVPHGVEVIDGDVRDPGLVRRLIDLKPHEIYHLAALSHVGESFDQAAEVVSTNTLGAVHMLEAARAVGARMYQASSSEIFGNAPAPQSEVTPFKPQSPYAAAKLAAHNMVQIYREAHGVHACNGILFNHESRHRGADFVTQKVARGVAAIAAGQQDVIELGSLDARRDWGHAADYVRGMVMMVRHQAPGDYVLATGKSRSVRELCATAFELAGIDDWQRHVVQSPALFRAAEVDHLLGDSSKAREELGWYPQISFESMIEEMIVAAKVSARHVNVG